MTTSLDQLREHGVDLTLTTSQALPVANSVLPRLRDQIEDGGDPVAALANAFVEGARFAVAETAAQLIEAGVDTRVTLELEPADGSRGPE